MVECAIHGGKVVGSIPARLTCVFFGACEDSTFFFNRFFQGIMFYPLPIIRNTDLSLIQS